MSARRNIADLTAVKLKLSQQDSGSFCQTHKLPVHYGKHIMAEGGREDVAVVTLQGRRKVRSQIDMGRPVGYLRRGAENPGVRQGPSARRRRRRGHRGLWRHVRPFFGHTLRHKNIPGCPRVGWLDFLTETLVKGGSGTQRAQVKARYLTQRLRQTKSEGTREIRQAKVFTRARSQTSSTH